MTEQNEKKVPRMLTIAETAALFKGNGGITDTYLRRAIREGIIPVIKVGRKALVNVDRLIDQLNGVEEEGEEDSQRKELAPIAMISKSSHDDNF